jgi:predicted SnoaL-like aldol condensation-catalyzing enzyme
VRLEANKRTVPAFYEAGLNQKDFATASGSIGPRYFQHNPLIADRIEGFRAFVSHIKETFSDLRADLKRVFADGDFVIVQTHGTRVSGRRGSAIVDIFRLEEGKIVEAVADAVLAGPGEQLPVVCELVEMTHLFRRPLIEDERRFRAAFSRGATPIHAASEIPPPGHFHLCRFRLHGRNRARRSTRRRGR